MKDKSRELTPNKARNAGRRDFSPQHPLKNNLNQFNMGMKVNPYFSPRHKLI